MTAEPRDVEEIRGDIALWAVHPFGAYPTHEQHCARERLLADVEPLLDRLAAADRENAELRGEVERLRRKVAADSAGLDRWCNYQDRLYEVMTSAEITAFEKRLDGGGWTNEPMCRHEAERDDLRAQLAAAQAQLAEFDRECYERSVEQQDALARLEAVRAIAQKWACDHIGFDEIAAALSAAPQPEHADDCPGCTSGTDDHDVRYWNQPSASDEPARCGCARCDNLRRADLPFPESLCRFMIVCETCGNKRCPHAAWHGNSCTGSNEPGQPGSNYPAVRWAGMFGIAPDFDGPAASDGPR